MNILYIEHYAGSPDMGMEFRPYYFSREWIKLGHKVTIFAGDYSHLRKKNPIVSQDFQIEDIDGIEYVWLTTGQYEGNGTKRALTMERFVRKLYIHAGMIAKKWEPDVVIASSTYPLDTYPAQKIAKIAKAKYVHEVHDMWPATLYEVGGMSKYHPFVVIMQLAENSAYKHCNKCVALAPNSKDYMVKHGLRSDKYVNIQNGIVQEEWENPQTIPDKHKHFFETNRDKFIVGYFGGHALSNSLDTILDTAKIMDDEDIIFVLVGNGVEKERLIQRKVNERLCNVVFLDQVAKQCVPHLTSFFDCSIMTGKPSPLYKYGLCLNKMYDSMMAGKPIICAISAPNTQVEEYDCGIQVSSALPEDIKDAIIQLKSMTTKERSRFGENGRKAVLKYFTYKGLAKIFLENMK